MSEIDLVGEGNDVCLMPRTESCFGCWYGEADSRVKEWCFCIWPMQFGRHKEVITEPTFGECKAFESRVGKETEAEFDAPWYFQGGEPWLTS